MTDAERNFQGERAGGNYGAGTKELQQRNYIARKETERKRKEMFEDALADFRAGKVRRRARPAILLAPHTRWLPL